MTLLWGAVIAAGCERGTPWQQIAEGPLPARWGHVAVYDAKRDRMLVFGGQSTSSLLSDVWALDLATLAWQQVETHPGPSPRTNLAAVLDGARDRLVIIDGRVDVSTPLSDVWALDLTTNTWTESASAPPARLDLPVASDGQRAWVFGGVGEPLQSLDDLWELDLSTDQWRQLCDDGVRPAARGSSAMAFWNGGVYLIGGHDYAVVHRDVWRYDLAAEQWQELSPSGGLVAAAHFGYAFDPTCNAEILSSGDNLDNYDLALTDALTLTDPAGFALIPSSKMPPPRDHATMIEDLSRRQLVLYGGGSLGDGLGLLGDAWTRELGACP
jgi:N-acetylneuraminic acid mutarotase